MRLSGPLGLDRDEWNRFEVDGDGDGLIRRAMSTSAWSFSQGYRRTNARSTSRR